MRARTYRDVHFSWMRIHALRAIIEVKNRSNTRIRVEYDKLAIVIRKHALTNHTKSLFIFA